MMGAMRHSAALTLMCTALLGVTRTGRYRAAANALASENLIFRKEKPILAQPKEGGAAEEKMLDEHVRAPTTYYTARSDWNRGNMGKLGRLDPSSDIISRFRSPTSEGSLLSGLSA